MTTLFREELTRARRREVVRFVAIASLAGVLVGCIIAGVQSHRPSDEEWAAAEALQQRAFHECVAQGSGSMERQESECDPGPIASWLSPDIKVFDLESLPSTIVWSSLILGLAGWLMGSTLIGADWANGTMGMLLTWEPRRSRLLTAKLCAVALVTLVLSAVLLAALVLGLVGVAQTRGLTGVSSGFWTDVGFASVRVVIISTAAAVAAGAVAFVARSATFAVATLFVYLVAVEGPVHLRLPGLARWLIAKNAMAWTAGKGSDAVHAVSRNALDVSALGVVAIWLAVALAVSWWTFRTRDIVS